MTRVLFPLDSPRRPADADALPDSSTVCVSSSCVPHSVPVDPTLTRSSLTQSLSARSKPASSGPPTIPVSSATQTSSLGHRRKGFGRRVRRHQRARGRPGDRKSGKEERMEEDGEQEEERMEAEAAANK